MNTKEAIEWIEDCKDQNLSEEYDNKKMSEIIRLLQRGEKYEAMWEELEKNTVYNLDGNYKHNWSEELIGIMHRLKRDFPKQFKKTVTIEMEAEKDHILTHHINLLKADLERRQDCPKVKYNIKESE